MHFIDTIIPVQMLRKKLSIFECQLNELMYIVQDRVLIDLVIYMTSLILGLQCGNDKISQQFPHQLGQQNVLREDKHAGQSSHHHTQRGARADRVHLHRQNRDINSGLCH